MTLTQWIDVHIDSLISGGATRIDGEVDEGSVKAYVAGSIVRIDLKPITGRD